MNDDEQELRNRLEAITPPPTRLELDGLVEAGRRRAFRRRSWQAAGGVALATAALVAVPTVVIGSRSRPEPVAPTLAAAPSSAGKPSAPTCQGTNLRVPSGHQAVSATGVDPSGRYIIGQSFSGQNFQPILWTDRTPKALPMIAKSMELSTVNAKGVVAGLGTDDANRDFVFRYENGRYTRMGTPPGDWHVYPVPEMNAAGDIVINAEPRGNSGGKGSIALFWKAGTKTAVTLPLPEEANVHDITDDGTIVGGTYQDGVGQDAYVWDQTGKGRKLKTPAGTASLAYAAQGNWVTGGYWTGQQDAEPVAWNLATGRVTKLPRGGPGDMVNGDGWVVALGMVFVNGKQLALPAPKGQQGGAQAVSDTGLVVGSTQEKDVSDTLRPRVWQC